ncbi:serine protease [Porifericola rhodea]|uniref:S1 family peptidase n=1 Tax=Porifericola rhodea TaxID=930972 RepID=UPI002666767F|nr:serine protease [Porifericola rhodea]WKN30314.1 serine protease [Porifericola rhodea]
MFIIILILSSFLSLSSLEKNEFLEDSTVINRIEKIEEALKKNQKDVWDKLNAVSGIVSGIVVALIGIYATNALNRSQKRREDLRKDQQLSISQADTLEKFLPHLMSDDPRLRESSLLIISTLLGDELATELAGKLGGEGSATALSIIASKSTEKSKDSIEVALGSVFNQLENYVVRIGMHEPDFIGNGFIFGEEGLVVTAAHVANGLTSGFYVANNSRGKMHGKIVYVSEDLDIAFIKIQEVSGIAGISAKASLPKIGSKIFTLWHSPNAGLRGEVSTVISTSAKGLSTEPEIAVSNVGSPGISGAPVIDSTGKLVGFVHASSTGHNPMTFLVPANAVVKAIEQFKNEG